MAAPEEAAISIKKEVENLHEEYETTIIKIESDVTPKQEIEPNDNPFVNIHLEINYDLNSETKVDTIETNINITECNDSVAVEKDTNGVEIKNEVQMDEHVSYDYPDFDDSVSIDSNDATALGNVEACLQEEINIKCENEGVYDVSTAMSFYFNLCTM